MCEPNFHLPQKINIDELRNFNGSKLSNASNKNLNFVPDEEKTGFSYISPIEYNVQPKYSNPYDGLNTMLSVKYNDYLLCRWNAFLQKVPEKYVRIRLFVDYKKDKEVSVIRRKILNGQFYGVDNKLNPVPHLKDPRRIQTHLKYY